MLGWKIHGRDVSNSPADSSPNLKSTGICRFLISATFRAAVVLSIHIMHVYLPKTPSTEGMGSESESDSDSNSDSDSASDSESESESKRSQLHLLDQMVFSRCCSLIHR